VIWHLILRNIIRNRKSNAIVLVLIGIITLVFFIGYSLIGKSAQGMRDAYINSVTGDVVIEKSEDVTTNLFGANIAVIDDYFTIPSLPAHNALFSLIASEPDVAGLTSQVSSKAFLDFESYREPALICGVDVKTYFRLFPGIAVVEGRFLEDGEYGAMITVEKALAIEKATGVRPVPGSLLLLTSGGNIGFKIVEAAVVGIYKYQNPGTFMNEIVITDPQTARVLSAIQVATSDVEANSEAVAIIGTDVDDLFGDLLDDGLPDGLQADGDAAIKHDAVASEYQEGLSPESVLSFLSGMKESSPKPVAGGDWNFIIVRLNKSLFLSSEAFIASLNKKISPFGVTAVNWQTAAGESAATLLLVQWFFNIGVILVSITGIITIINILLISIFKRKREIGTLRAIGADDAAVRTLILGESFVLSCIAGLVGILTGFIFLFGINFLHIPISNNLIASLFGGPVLTIQFSPQSALVSFVLAVFLGLAASLYPVETAVRIEPAVALRDN
jgi:ABC-type lipoprotein release transport system permease subunit